MVLFDVQAETTVSELSKIDELSGKLEFSDVDDKLMHSVLENDKDVLDEGKLIENAINQGMGAFTPDLMFEQMVDDFSIAKTMYGETILRQLFGYDADYLERNLKIPEFRRLLKRTMAQNLKHLQHEGLLDSTFNITEKAYELAALVMYVEELDNIIPKGIQGEREYKKLSHYGGAEDVKQFKKGDRYKDIALKKSVKMAIRRGHPKLEVEDLKVFERESRGQCIIIYAIDASGSMKGKKIGSCKKAGIALAYRAITRKDKVGLIVFGDEVRAVVEPTMSFPKLLKEIAAVKASRQTDIVKTIRKAVEMFPQEHVTKHLLLMTDALPTAGEEPEKETLEAVAIARNAGITVSLVGINLDLQGSKLAERIAEVGGGKLYIIRDLEQLGKIVLEDYYGVG